MSSKMAELRILVVLVIGLFIVGVVLLILSHYSSDHALTHDISRDIGVAFLISAIVTGAYETYARARFDLAKITSLLDTVYGSGVPAGIWDSIKLTLLNRQVMRCNAALHVRALRDKSVGNDNVVLEVDLTYDLVSLLSKETDFEVVHGLDEHIAAAHLPRFLEVSVRDHSEAIAGREPWQSSSGDIKVNSGFLSIKVKLPASSEKSVPIRVRRQEIRWCPGSYYLIMSEITDGMKIYLDECAEDICVSVFYYPAAKEVNLTTNHIAITEGPLLPGHCLEFKITNKTPADPAALRSAHAA